jgi:hypothetical protein
MAIDELPWTLALAVMLGVLLVAVLWRRRTGNGSTAPLPTRWPLQPRVVLSGVEGRVFRHLVASLPEHAILIKLPLVRFCQPTELDRVQYWFELLGSTHVQFAVSTKTGRIVAAVDIASDRPDMPRTRRIKEAVLGACRIRHLRIDPTAMPNAAEMRELLLPTMPFAMPVPEPVAPTPRRRSERRPAKQAQPEFADSFFDPQSRHDAFLNSEFGALASRRAMLESELSRANGAT